MTDGSLWLNVGLFITFSAASLVRSSQDSLQSIMKASYSLLYQLNTVHSSYLLLMTFLYITVTEFSVKLP